MDTNEQEETKEKIEKTDGEKDKEKSKKVDKVVIYQMRGKKEKWTTDKKTNKKYTPSKPTSPKSDQDKKDAMKASEKILRQQVRALPINNDPKPPVEDTDITESAELEIQADDALLTDMQDNTEPEPYIHIAGKNERNHHKKEDRKGDRSTDRKKCCDLCSHTPSQDEIIYVVEHEGEHLSTRQNSIAAGVDKKGLVYCTS